MAIFCSQCGTKLPDEAAFCPSCGARVSREEAPAPLVTGAPEGSKAVVSDGPPAPARSAGRRSSGARPPAAPNRSSASRPGAEISAKPKKGRRGLSLFLVLVMLVELGIAGFKYPGFLRKGGGGGGSVLSGPVIGGGDGDGVPGSGELEPLTPEDLARSPERTAEGISTIVFTSADALGEPERATVSAEDPEARLPGGVSVRFGEFCLSGEPRELAVQRFAEKSDGEYRAVCYDLTLDGGSAEFAGLATVSLPYDPSWGDNVCVQFFNEDSGAWEILYAEAENGIATFRVGHFCSFAVFRRMVDSANAADAEGEIFTIRENLTDEYRPKAELNYRILAAQIKAGKLAADDSLAMLVSGTDRFWVDRSLTVTGNTITGADYYIKIEGLLANAAASPVLRSLSKKLGAAGMIITGAKVLYQWHRDGFGKALTDNAVDLTALTASLTASAVGGPVGMVLAAAVLCYYVYSTVDATVTDIALEGNGSVEELAYRKFTSRYATYYRPTGVIGYRYFRDKLEDASMDRQLLDGEHPLPASAVTGYAEWKTVFDDALIRRDKTGANPVQYVDKVIRQYVNVFWRVSAKVRKKYLEETEWGVVFREPLSKSYHTPSAEDQAKFSAAFEKDLYAFLKPYMVQLMENQYEKTLSETFAAFTSLEKELNSEITVQLVDPAHTDFIDSPYASHMIGLTDASGGRIQMTVPLDGRLTFTKLGWLRKGAPSVLRVMGFDGEPDLFNIRFDMKAPVTTVTLEADPGVWELQEIEYREHLEDKYSQCTIHADADSFSIYSENGDGKKTLTGELPGAVATTQQLNDAFNASTFETFMAIYSLYERIPEDCSYHELWSKYQSDRVEFHYLNGPSVKIPEADAAGNRVLVLQLGGIGITLYYRERSVDAASDKAWKHYDPFPP